MEKECTKHGLVTFKKEKNKSMKEGFIWRCTKCCVERQALQRNRRKEKLAALLGGACSRCGYDRCIAVLDFHHRDPSQKSFGIAKRMNCAWDDLVKEVQKCDLLCKNCHYELEYEVAAERRSGS